VIRRLLRGLLRQLFLALVRLYYPRRQVLGIEHLPADAQHPVLFTANHPNGLLDPLVLALVVGRPVRFLAKSTFFRNPLGRLAMSCFDAIPVYRTQDLPATDAGDRNSRNETSFESSRQALAAGQWLALFPEGTSHSDPQLRPLKTGAARIALSSAAATAATAANVPAGSLAVVPVGLAYESKAIFRSAVQVVFGRPLSPEPQLPAWRRDERAAVEALTGEIRQALDAVVLQAETTDLLAGIAQVAAWTADDPAAATDPRQREQRARRLLAAYQQMRERDPARVERIVQAARDYSRWLLHLGVHDPWALEVPRVTIRQLLRSVAKLAVTAPLALVGAALGWLPYRAAAPFAARVTDETDVLGTVKLMSGALFVTLAWAVEATLAGLWWGPPGALGVLALAPLGGYAALRFSELAAETSQARHHLQLRRSDPILVARVIARRRALAQQIAEALAGESFASRPP
jgi:glycerol-3-phosphate O-acyltransferase/dihydroxyacetone phosphate acyltransferase